MKTQSKVRFTVVAPRELKDLVDDIAREEKTSRSQVISRCLEELAKKRTEQLMEEGYKAMAGQQQETASLTFDLQSQAVSEWK